MNLAPDTGESAELIGGALDLPDEFKEVVVDEAFVRRYPWAKDRDTVVVVSKAVIAGHVFVCLGDYQGDPPRERTHFVAPSDLQALVARKILRVVTRFPTRDEVLLSLRRDDVNGNPPVSVGLLRALDRIYDWEDLMADGCVLPLSLDPADYDSSALGKTNRDLQRARRVAKNEKRGGKRAREARGHILAFTDD